MSFSTRSRSQLACCSSAGITLLGGLLKLVLRLSPRPPLVAADRALFRPLVSIPALRLPFRLQFREALFKLVLFRLVLLRLVLFRLELLRLIVGRSWEALLIEEDLELMLLRVLLLRMLLLRVLLLRMLLLT